MACLLLALGGPLQSWGSRSRFSDADTAGWYMPSFMAARETLRSVNTVCRTRIK